MELEIDEQLRLNHQGASKVKVKTYENVTRWTKPWDQSQLCSGSPIAARGFFHGSNIHTIIDSTGRSTKYWIVHVEVTEVRRGLDVMSGPIIEIEELNNILRPSLAALGIPSPTGGALMSFLTAKEPLFTLRDSIFLVTDGSSAFLSSAVKGTLDNLIKIPKFSNESKNDEDDADWS